jgi:hypothetical protein
MRLASSLEPQSAANAKASPTSRKAAIGALTFLGFAMSVAVANVAATVIFAPAFASPQCAKTGMPCGRPCFPDLMENKWAVAALEV